MHVLPKVTESTVIYQTPYEHALSLEYYDLIIYIIVTIIVLNIFKSSYSLKVIMVGFIFLILLGSITCQSLPNISIDKQADNTTVARQAQDIAGSDNNSTSTGAPVFVNPSKPNIDITPPASIIKYIENEGCVCPDGIPIPNIVYGGSSRYGWKKIPSISIFASSADDTRVQLVKDAVEFWNWQISNSGSPFRLGSIKQTSEMVPDDYLIQLSNTVTEGTPCPSEPALVSGNSEDILVILSNANFVSFSYFNNNGKCIVAIRNCSVYPFNTTNVARNLIAHELGHAIGLRHNNDPMKLMCGRPAKCRPPDFKCDCEKYFPVTDEEREFILNLYPATWRSTQEEMPAYQGFVNDYANLLSSTSKSMLEAKLAKLEKDTTAEVAVLTINTIEGNNIDGYANKLFNKWGLGKKDKNNGVLFLIVLTDRKTKIEVGYGLESVITNDLAQNILDQKVLPQFKIQNYENGILNGIQAMEESIRKMD